MTTKNLAIPLIALLLAGPACTVVELDPTSDKDINIETRPAENFQFTNVKVSRENETFTVSGSLLHNKDRSLHEGPGHVHITVYGKDDEIVAFTAVPYRQTHPHAAFLQFFASIHAMEGARVLLIQHEGIDHEDDGPSAETG